MSIFDRVTRFLRRSEAPSEVRQNERAGADADEKDRLGGIPGADAAALGLTPTPGLEPTVAQVDPTSTETPAAFDHAAAVRESKPWATSLAYQSPQVGEDASVEGDEEDDAGRAPGQDVAPDEL